MRFASIYRRLRAIESESADLEEQMDPEIHRLMMHAFEEYLIKHLQGLECSEVVEDVKAALKTVGPRPFGHTRPDDRPVWAALDDVEREHNDLAYRIKAAEALAWADVFAELDCPEDHMHRATFNELAADYLRRDAKERQTFCDICGRDLGNWWCYMNDKKICRACEGGLHH